MQYIVAFFAEYFLLPSIVCWRLLSLPFSMHCYQHFTKAFKRKGPSQLDNFKQQRAFGMDEKTPF